jgi:methionyl-tRNA formyltransferase
MDIVFLGANDAGFAIYDWLCDRENCDVHALLTRPEQLSMIESVEPDLVVAAGFDHIVPPEILDVPERGCLNVHPGLLPHARGYNPNVWSIVEGLPAGVTIHWMDEGIDTGDIVATREVPVSFADTGKDLYERLEQACYDLFVETWPSIREGDVDATEQTDADATYHEKSDFTELCELDPDETYTVRELLDRLRALTFPPFDNAHVEVDGERYYVDVSITPATEAEDPDRVGLLDAY